MMEWAAINLTDVLQISVELSHQDLNNDVLEKVQIRAGLDETPASDGSTPTGENMNWDWEAIPNNDYDYVS